ncbi:primosomal protein N' [Faecalibacterium hattorii]|uniref:Replication restart protein PriA n=1 Tax=Faecalibacterium hattorii TaxID=2935520 RepID=A0A329UKN5_9FIRM|nr:primosomal protein N' [Faecalibacterium hattorii]RAW63183.1 primosomal protein N' [Faecalibacterium hattorii]
MPKTVGVAVSNATFHFDKLYTYAVMPDQQNAVRLGSMVLVPFGRGSRARMGVVLACDEEPESSKLKFLFDVAPASACLTPELLRLVHFLKERTFCTYYEAVKAVIPYGAQYKPAVAADGVTPVLQKQLTRHTENSYKLAGTLPAKPKPTAKQLAAVALLGGGERTQTELEEKGISRAVLDNLCAKGVLECSKVNKSIDLYSSIPLKNEPIRLTAEQQAAYEALLPHLEDAAPHGALLYGVTGSGKTLVFLKLIERCLQLGRRALVLVPEISLTPQMILRLKSRFGKRVAVQHSALNHTERLLQWQMIQDGGADIVVGTRSAIFSPLENIGLVIIDEEQEHTYRSESAPRYSAHEVARQRAAENGALLLLASATPSTESYFAAQHGRTQLVRLTQRYGGNPLPHVEIVDMRAELASGNPREISLALEDAIRRNLDAGKQTILLLNRRGYQTIAQCEDCREVLKCQKCSVPMVYHKSAHKLLCHYCGSQMDPPPQKCPTCGGKLQYRGFGTQKAEEELAKLFPEARILRMDQDSTAAKDAHEKLLAKFARHEYDIMVGTQMVAKGLDFEDVTLVGVLGIDSLLFAQGFRAYETVFSLVTQVVGRSGRAKDPGFAIIQTTDPNNPVLNLAAAQDYDAFFEQEIAYRKLGLYPPFCGLCVVGFAGPKEIEVARAAARFAALLGQQAAKQPDLPLRVLGPTPGNIEKINEAYRYKLTVKCRNDRRFRDLMRETLGLYEQEKLPGKATVVVDLHSDGDI